MCRRLIVKGARSQSLFPLVVACTALMTAYWILSLTALGQDDEVVASCTSNAECPEGYFCNTPPGECDGVGECVELPGDEAVCPMPFAPVCGCDGSTYDNDCLAFVNGTSVQHVGVCAGEPCNLDAQCGPNAFCQTKPGDCGGVGVCVELPGPNEFCPMILAPVCGCDGNTYDNDCFAFASGVSIQHTGICDGDPCEYDFQCAKGAFCQTPPGDCDGQGVCTTIPDAVCLAVYDPVCGCDGHTFGNACEALVAGASIAHEGECGCKADLNSDGVVDTLDLLQILAAWGPCVNCAEDLAGNGDVNVEDLLILIAAWGPCM